MEGTTLFYCTFLAVIIFTHTSSYHKFIKSFQTLLRMEREEIVILCKSVKQGATYDLVSARLIRNAELKPVKGSERKNNVLGLKN